MDRLIVPASLKHEYTGTLRVVRVVLHDDGFENSFHDFPRQEPVRQQFIVTVL